MPKALITLGFSTALLVAVPPVLANECNIEGRFIQKDKETISYNPVRTRVFDRQVLMDDSVVVFSEKMKVNTDGTVRSYGVNDLGAQKCNPKKGGPATGDPFALGCAMNTVCNGFDAIKVRTQTSLSCSEEVSLLRLLKENDWDTRRLPDYSFDFFGIAIDENGKVCVNSEQPNFFVSPASAQSGLGGGACAQKSYMDALLPSVVVPRCWTARYYTKHPQECRVNVSDGARPDVRSGDMIVLQRRDGSAEPIYGLIGDIGPANKLGEISVGMAMKALDKPAPRYLYESYGMSDVALMDVLIFRQSEYPDHKTEQNWPDVEHRAEARFATWGGGNLDQAKAKLRNCGAEVRSGN